MSPLFQATHRGRRIIVDHASAEELAALSTNSTFGLPRDTLESWSLVALRNLDCHGSKVHALGWRVGLANTWITSALTMVDLPRGLVATQSGHAYSLGEKDCQELEPVLREHLLYALGRWGFQHVR